MQPLDLTEWAQSLLSGPNSDWAKEVLDLIENNRADEWAELVEDIEHAVDHRKAVVEPFDQEDAKRALENLCDKVNTLDEIAEKLATAGFLPIRSDPDDGLQLVLDKLGAVSDIMDWVRSPEDHAEAIADLRKLFPLPEPKKPATPKLGYDL